IVVGGKSATAEFEFSSRYTHGRGKLCALWATRTGAASLDPYAPDRPGVANFLPRRACPISCSARLRQVRRWPAKSGVAGVIRALVERYYGAAVQSLD